MALGRPWERAKNDPRTIDLDLLYADRLVVSDEVLELPHPRLAQRRFVLEPLSEIRPGLLLPGHEASVSSLLAGISGPDDAIDGDLETFAGFTLLLDLLKIVSSLDLAVELPEGKRVAAGKYAAFAVSLPPSLLQLSLGLNVKVATFLGDQATGDSTSLSLPQLNLLGLGGTQYGFIGLQVTKPYDKAVISLGSDVLSISLAKDSLRVHELCVNGHKVAG